MATSGDAVITISAKDLTKAGFDAARASLKGLGAEATRSGGLFGNLTTQVKATALGFISAQAVIGTVQTAFRMLGQFVGDSVQSYAAAEAAQKKLTTALQAAGRATPETITQFNDLATTFQKTTVYSDDLITEMQALLVQVGNVMPSEMGKALTAATDLASGLGIDLETATKLVGKAFAGETGTLKRYGIVIDEAKLKAEGMPAVLDAIQSRFGGQAQAEAETYAGKLKQIANAWDNVKEAVGGVVVMDPLVVAFLRSLNTGLAESEAAATRAASAQKHLHDNVNLTNEGIFAGSPIMATFVQGLRDWAMEANAAADAEARLQLLIKNAPKVGAASFGPPTRPNQFGTGGLDVGKYLTDYEEATKKAKAASEAYAKALQSLRDQLSGTALQADVKQLAQAFVGLTAKQLDNVDVQMRVGKAAADLRTRGADLSPILEALATRYERLNTVMNAQIPLLERTPKAWRDAAISAMGYGEQLPLIKDKTRLVNDAISALFLNSKTTWRLVGTEVKAVTVDFGALAQSLSQLSQISGSAFSGLARELAIVVGAVATAKQGGEQMASGLDAIQAGGKGAGAGMVQFAAGLTTAIAALDTATQSTDKFKSALGGAAAGAQTGASASVGNPWATAIGAIVGGVWGLIKASQNAEAVEASLYAQLMTTANGASTLAEKMEYMTARSYTIDLRTGAVSAARELVLDTAADLQMFLSSWGQSAMAGAEAAGYKTIAQLQTIADKAKEVYDYMVASGKYGAAAIAAAFQASKDAAIAAMGEEATAHQAALDEIAARYDEMFSKIDSEMKSLSASVAAEAEEAVMGTIEIQERARLAELEKERDALEKQKELELTAAEETYAAWLAAGKTTDDALRKLFERPYKIPIEWVYPGDPLGGGGSGSGTGPGSGGRQGFAEGTGGQYVNFGAGQDVRLHGWERVMTAAEGRTGSSVGGDVKTLIIQNVTDGRVLSETVLRYQGRVLAPYGIH